MILTVTCLYVQAYNAQNAGAKAILIVDNVEESLLTMSNPEERPEIAKLKNDITIATALVKKVGTLARQFFAALLAVTVDRWHWQLV